VRHAKLKQSGPAENKIFSAETISASLITREDPAAAFRRGKIEAGRASETYVTHHIGKIRGVNEAKTAYAQDSSRFPAIRVRQTSLAARGLLE
jgi:hypothetical protein